MGFAITVALPSCGSKFLPRRSFGDKGAFYLAACFEFCSVCRFLRPTRPLLGRHQRSVLNLKTITKAMVCYFIVLRSSKVLKFPSLLLVSY